MCWYEIDQDRNIQRTKHFVDNVEGTFKLVAKIITIDFLIDFAKLLGMVCFSLSFTLIKKMCVLKIEQLVSFF